MRWRVRGTPMAPDAPARSTFMADPGVHRHRARAVPAPERRAVPFRVSAHGPRDAPSCALAFCDPGCRETGKAVDAVRVSAGPVGGQLFRALASGRVQESLARSQKLHARDPVSAGASDPLDGDVDDRPSVGQIGETWAQLLEIVAAGFEDAAAAVETDHQRRVVEGAEHEGY